MFENAVDFVEYRIFDGQPGAVDFISGATLPLKRKVD
jgi:uncharacterized protein with FMN-binding domain